MSDLVVSALLFSFSKFKYSVRDCKLTFDPVIFFKVYLNMFPSVIFVKSLIFQSVAIIIIALNNKSGSLFLEFS